MMQLVGYYVWMAGAKRPELTKQDVERGVELARKDFEQSVLETTYRELSNGDRAFLRAMVAEGEESRLSAIARIMGKPNGYASSYKSRLIKQGVIEELPGGTLVIAPPFFREYLEKAFRAES